MEDASQEEAIHGVLKHCAKQRSNGVADFEIIQELIDSGVDPNVANKFVEQSKEIQYKKTSKVMPLLGMLAGIVVAGIGIGITSVSDGRVIAYGAIIVGIIWFFRGLIAMFDD